MPPKGWRKHKPVHAEHFVVQESELQRSEGGRRMVPSWARVHCRECRFWEPPKPDPDAPSRLSVAHLPGRCHWLPMHAPTHDTEWCAQGKRT